MVEKKDAKVRVDVSCLAVEGNEMKKVNTGQKKKTLDTVDHDK